MGKLLLRVLAFLFVVTALFALGRSLFQADWKSKPTDEEMVAASDLLTLPLGSKIISSERLSRITFIGIVKTVDSDLSVDEASDHFRRLAESYGWSQKKVFDIRPSFRVIFCAGKISYDIEALPKMSGGTRIRAGSYWFADKGDDRFCREITGSGSKVSLEERGQVNFRITGSG